MRSLALIILLAITPALIGVSHPPAGRLQVKKAQVAKPAAFNFACRVKSVGCNHWSA